MSQGEEVSRPNWVSDEMFPFESKFFGTSAGHRMHFIDEGAEEPVVFVHGNPSWSFEFRHLIDGLRSQSRCIAMDHIGFGLSSRSARMEDHTPQAHADAFTAFMEHLGLEDITLYMTDWGGPIGLDFVRRHPDRVKRIVIANTWCWSVSADRHFRIFSFMMSNPIGQFAIKRFNLFVNQVMPRAVGRKDVLTPEVMEHYRKAQPDPAARLACAAFPRAIIGASDWLASIWDERSIFAEKPALILWGLKDIAFRRKELERWQSELMNAETYEFENAGHFLAEEAPDDVLSALSAFIGRA